MVEGPMPQFRRKPAAKMFVAEIKESTYQLPKSGGDDYESTNYLTPTGEIVSKVMIVGTAVEKEDIGKDQPFWRLRVVDSTGGIAVYAGQYQAEAAQVIAGIEIPCHIAIAGKMSVYEPENGNKILSIRPESVAIITQEDRNSFILDAAEQLAARIKEPKNGERVKEIYPQWDSKLLTKTVVDALRDLVEPKVEPPAQPPAVPAEKPTAPEEPKDEKTQKRTEADKKAKKPEQEAKTKVSVADLKELIIKIVTDCDKGKGCQYGTVLEKMKESGITPEAPDFDSAISKLMREGRIYEPKIGSLKVT